MITIDYHAIPPAVNPPAIRIAQQQPKIGNESSASNGAADKKRIDKPSPKNEIIVTGAKIDAQNLPDRKNYDVTKLLQSNSGSAADVLRNLPSVDVDAQGVVTIRGDSNIQILIDGKPSTTMGSRTRADALEQLPANTIARVEVVTTPGAQFKPDGSGGIINIVTKRSSARGLSGSVHADGGTDGTANINADLTYRTAKLTLSGSAALHRDVRWRPFSDHRIETDQAENVTDVNQTGIFGGARYARTVTASIGYDVTQHDRVSAHGSYEYRTGIPRIDQFNVVRDGQSQIMSAFDRTGTGDEDEVDSEISASYKHSFPGTDHRFTLELREGQSVENESRLFRSSYSFPANLKEIDEQFPRAQEIQRELTVEYTQPLAGGQVLAGYDLQRNDDDYLNRGIFIDPVTDVTTTDPSRTNRFHYREIINAWYATYNRALVPRLTGDFGLRVEESQTTTRQFELAQNHTSNYLRVYPTAHLEYSLGTHRKLRFGYSSRIVRPDPEDLDPYPVFADPLSERAGNPNLQPEVIKALELEYEHQTKVGAFDATAFVRRTSNQFTIVSRPISPTVVLTTHENLGASTSAGIDLSDKGNLSKGLSFQMSGSLYHDEINAANLGFLQTRSALIVDAKGELDASVSNRDMIQISGNYRGKRLLAQGYRLAYFSTDVGFRHTFPNHLVATLTLSDLFDTRRDRIRIDTPQFMEFLARRNGGRHISLSLTLPFGPDQSGTKR